MPKLIHFLKGVLLPFFQKRKKAVAAVHRIAGFQILQRQTGAVFSDDAGVCSVKVTVIAAVGIVGFGDSQSRKGCLYVSRCQDDVFIGAFRGVAAAF